jgi:hypothetical protein
MNVLTKVGADDSDFNVTGQYIFFLYILAYQTGVSVSFTHAGNFIWHGGAK